MKNALAQIKDFGWIATSLATLIGGAWIVVTYLHTASLQYEKEFNDNQVRIAFATANDIAGLISAPDESEWEKSKSGFWNHFWGDLVLFESEEVAKAMVDLGKALGPSVSYSTRGELTKCILEVSKALRTYLAKKQKSGWKIDLGALAGFDELLPDNPKSPNFYTGPPPPCMTQP